MSFHNYYQTNGLSLIFKAHLIALARNEQKLTIVGVDEARTKPEFEQGLEA